MNGAEKVATGAAGLDDEYDIEYKSFKFFRTLVPYVLRNIRPDNEYCFFTQFMLHGPFRSTPEQLHFLHWFPSFCDSSFISWSSNF